MRELVTCPHCGYKYRTDVKAVVADGETIAVRGIFHRKPTHRRATSIDLACPYCGKTFVHEVES